MRYVVREATDDYRVINSETDLVIRHFNKNDTGRMQAQQVADHLNDPNFSMTVAGRLVRTPIVSVERYDDGTMKIRIDDLGNEEFYVELTVKGPDIPEGIFTSRGGSEVFLEN
jgi:hypothetical protein